MPRQVHFVMVVIWVRSSLLPSSTVSTGCGRYSLTILSTGDGQDSLFSTSLSKSTSPPASRFSGAKSGLAMQN